jgi:hypothetical protein
MQLLYSTTSNGSVNAPVQKQTQNPIIQGFKLVLSKLLIAKSCTSMLLGDYSLDEVGEFFRILFFIGTLSRNF